MDAKTRDALEPLVDLIEARLLVRLTTPDVREPWVTIKAAAEHAACSPDVIRAAIKAGKLRAGRAGTDMRVRLTEVDRWILADGEGVEDRSQAARTADRVLDVMKGPASSQRRQAGSRRSVSRRGRT